MYFRYYDREKGGWERGWEVKKEGEKGRRRKGEAQRESELASAALHPK